MYVAHILLNHYTLTLISTIIVMVKRENSQSGWMMFVVVVAVEELKENEN